MNKIKHKLILLFLMTVIASFTMTAAEKIGIVNMDKVFTSYYKTKLEDAKMKKQSDIYKTYLVSLNKTREKLSTEFIRLRDATQNIAYSDAEREKNRIEAQNKYRQLQAKETEIEQYNNDKKKQLFNNYKKVREKLIEEIMKVVKAKAKRMNFTVVLDSSGSSLNNIPAIIYYNKSIDFTDDVIKELNLGH